MADFRHQAELAKLARLLHTSPESLGFLGTLDSAALHALRHATARRRFPFDARSDLRMLEHEILGAKCKRLINICLRCGCFHCGIACH